jgi:spore maturation protein CgeB
MTEQAPRVMIVGHFGRGSLESSYRTAFESCGCEVLSFDVVQALVKHCRFGRFGRIFHNFVPVEAWVRKANRDLITEAFVSKPNYVLTFGHYPIRAGALAQINASINTRLVHVWPDTLSNVDAYLVSCLPLFDLVASYSRSSLEPLRQLGARRVAWIPLAADPSMHGSVECPQAELDEYRADVSFIGGWRPEREILLSSLESFDLKIWGPDWGRRCRANPAILKHWQKRPLYESDYAKAVTNSKINLNIIDPLNYPAANMRFFELPVSGGLQVSSACPEMEEHFLHGEDLFYYKDAGELRDLIVDLLADTPLRERVAKAAREKVLSGHTYRERALSILQQFENGRQ